MKVDEGEKRGTVKAHEKVSWGEIDLDNSCCSLLTRPRRLGSGLEKELYSSIMQRPISLQEWTGAKSQIPVRYVTVRTVDLPEFLGR